MILLKILGIAILIIGILVWLCETAPTVKDEKMENDNNEYTKKS